MRRALIPLLALSLLAPSARADNELSVRVSTQFLGQSGLFASGPSSAAVLGEFGYARRVARIWQGSVWIEGAFLVGSRSESDLFGNFHSELLLQSATVGARYALPVFRWLVPHLRLGAGALWGEYTLRGAIPESRDWAAAFTGYALAGVEVLIPRRVPRPGETLATAGLVVEGGYMLSTRLDF